MQHASKPKIAIHTQIWTTSAEVITLAVTNHVFMGACQFVRGTSGPVWIATKEDTKTIIAIHGMAPRRKALLMSESCILAPD